MRSLLYRSQFRQRPMLAVYAAALLGIALFIAAWCLVWVFSSSSDRLAVIANMLSFGTLLLALVAVIVALAAYSAATGLPDLRVFWVQPGELTSTTQIRLVPGSQKREGEPDGQIIADRVDKNIVTITVMNESSYAARSPAVVVDLQQTWLPPSTHAATQGWTATFRDLDGNIRSLQWDGGANYAVHGKGRRQLPPLNLGALRALEGRSAYISVNLLADGYSRKPITIPVEFKV
jgi:hypothetical protein